MFRWLALPLAELCPAARRVWREIFMRALIQTQAAQMQLVFFCVLRCWQMIRERNLDQSKAPIYEALQTFRQMRVVPFDVPGHKRGRGNPELTAFLGEQCVSIDVNSMKPLDNLCHPISVIRQVSYSRSLPSPALHD